MWPCQCRIATSMQQQHNGGVWPVRRFWQIHAKHRFLIDFNVPFLSIIVWPFARVIVLLATLPWATIPVKQFKYMCNVNFTAVNSTIDHLASHSFTFISTPLPNYVKKMLEIGFDSIEYLANSHLERVVDGTNGGKCARIMLFCKLDIFFRFGRLIYCCDFCFIQTHNTFIYKCFPIGMIWLSCLTAEQSLRCSKWKWMFGKWNRLMIVETLMEEIGLR